MYPLIGNLLFKSKSKSKMDQKIGSIKNQIAVTKWMKLGLLFCILFLKDMTRTSRGSWSSRGQPLSIMVPLILFGDTQTSLRTRAMIPLTWSGGNNDWTQSGGKNTASGKASQKFPWRFTTGSTKTCSTVSRYKEIYTYIESASNHHSDTNRASGSLVFKR